MKIINLAAVLAVFPLLSTTHATARPKVDAEQLIDEIIRCGNITERGAKLACFEATVPNLQAVRETGAFALRSSEKERAAFKELTSTVVSVTPLEPGKWLMVLKDNSVWQNGEAAFPAERGDAVHVVKGALGSYFANIADGKAVRVKRLR
jgi:hypothetical protein